MMHGHEKSDSAIVATKLPNKAGRPAAEAVERRAEAKENANRCRTRAAFRMGQHQHRDRQRKEPGSRMAASAYMRENRLGLAPNTVVGNA